MHHVCFVPGQLNFHEYVCVPGALHLTHLIMIVCWLVIYFCLEHNDCLPIIKKFFD